MATAGTKKDNDLLTCPICLETLKSPRSLPCLHTFCEQCISEYILSTERKAENKLSNYPCPVCRTLVTPIKPDAETWKWASSLPHNFTISSLMETKTKEKQECHLCKRQEKQSQATSWCRECSEALCEQCCNLHSFIKLFKSHKVVKIEDICTVEVDLSAISDACSVHSSKVIEAYCFDHKQLCCVLCLTLVHRKCEKVQAIEEISNVMENEEDGFEAELLTLESAVKMLKNEKHDENEVLVKSFNNIENSALQSVKAAKDKLDLLSASFLKELSLVRDDYVTKSTDKAAMIDQLLHRVEKVMKSTKMARNFGSKIQLFIHLEKIKKEMHVQIDEAVKSLREAKDFDVKFISNETLLKICDISSIGKISCLEKESKSVSNFKSFQIFKDINLKKKNSIFLSVQDIRGGISLTDQIVITSSFRHKTVSLVDVDTGNILSSCAFSFSSKRLALDKQNGILYVSCYASEFNRLPFNKDSNQFCSPTVIKDTPPYNGGVCIHNDFLFMVVESEIQKMDLSKGTGLQTCFKSNTNCTDLNGLSVDRKNKRLVHTTQDFKVVCTTFDGTEIFSYKDKHMKKVTSVTVSSKGLIFAGEEEGSVHVISEDGKQRKTILNKPEKIGRLCDVWLDKSEKTLFICGDQYIEMYDILY